MKNTKVKTPGSVLGLSKKSKDKIKTKNDKKSKQSFTSSMKKMIGEQISGEKGTAMKNLAKIVSDFKGKDKNKNIQKEVRPLTPFKKTKKTNLNKSDSKETVTKKTNLNQSDSKETVTEVKSTNNVKKSESNTKVEYLKKKNVQPALKALLNHCKSEDKKLLFKSEGTPIFAQIETIVVPTHPRTTLRVSLPHSLVQSVTDVLLIISDEKKHHRKLRHDDDMYIINFNDKLKELGVTEITKVMTLRQIRAEYYTHEMRRKLSQMFDVFLVDGKVATKLSSIIGKKIYESRKTPIPISLENDSKIKLEVERALKKTQIILKSSACTNSSCVIGHTDMKEDQIAENLVALSEGLDKCKYPGGWKNIKKLSIKTPTSIAFPVYISYVTPNEVGLAELKQTLPKRSVAVKGELSTIGRDVIVRPDGSIEVEGVDDMKSFMHQLYRHAGFKDHADLDLTNTEYKELLKELYKRLPEKKEEEKKAGEEKESGEMIVDNGEDDDDDSGSDSDDYEIEGEMQKDVNLKGDFEDDEKDEEDMEESYMKQWETDWLNQSEDEEEGEEGSKKGGKNKNKKNKKQNDDEDDDSDVDFDDSEEEEEVQHKNKKNKKQNKSINIKKENKKSKIDNTKNQQENKQKRQRKRNNSNKKDTPLRNKNGMKLEEAKDVRAKKNKKGNKKGGAKNFIPV